MLMSFVFSHPHSSGEYGSPTCRGSLVGGGGEIGGSSSPGSGVVGSSVGCSFARRSVSLRVQVLLAVSGQLALASGLPWVLPVF